MYCQYVQSSTSLETNHVKFNFFILDGSSYECVSIKQNRKKVSFEDIQYKFNIIIKTQN
jgi:hypothetical protein